MTVPDLILLVAACLRVAILFLGRPVPKDLGRQRVLCRPMEEATPLLKIYRNISSNMKNNLGNPRGKFHLDTSRRFRQSISNIFPDNKRSYRIFGKIFYFVPSEGIEPPSTGSKPVTLSIKLRGLNFNPSIFFFKS